MFSDLSISPFTPSSSHNSVQLLSRTAWFPVQQKQLFLPSKTETMCRSGGFFTTLIPLGRKRSKDVDFLIKFVLEHLLQLPGYEEIHSKAV